MAAVGVEGREEVEMVSSCFEPGVEEYDSKRNLDSSVELDKD